MPLIILWTSSKTFRTSSCHWTSPYAMGGMSHYARVANVSHELVSSYLELVHWCFRVANVRLELVLMPATFFFYWDFFKKPFFKRLIPPIKTCKTTSLVGDMPLVQLVLNCPQPFSYIWTSSGNFGTSSKWGGEWRRAREKLVQSFNFVMN